MDGTPPRADVSLSPASEIAQPFLGQEMGEKPYGLQPIPADLDLAKTAVAVHRVLSLVRL